MFGVLVSKTGRNEFLLLASLKVSRTCVLRSTARIEPANRVFLCEVGALVTDFVSTLLKFHADGVSYSYLTLMPLTDSYTTRRGHDIEYEEKKSFLVASFFFNLLYFLFGHLFSPFNLLFSFSPFS